MDRLTAEAAAGNLTVGAQARTALALLNSSAPGAAAALPAAVQAIQKRLLGSIRVAGRTAYVPVEPDSATAAGAADQALALLLFVRTGAAQSNPLVPKVAAYVGQGSGVVGGGAVLRGWLWTGARGGWG